MQQKYLRYICLLLILALGFKTSHATITVDSVHVTLSTCPNNGTAKVYARSTNSNAVFLFNIVSGPVTYTQQNDSTFYSLYPGNYTGWVHDVNSFDSVRFVFSVGGNYVAPMVSANSYFPLCATGASGRIVGQLVQNTGLAPYKWQIYAPDTGAYQASDTFNGLSAGAYTIRVSDACGIARLANTVVDSGTPGLTIEQYAVYFLNCDSQQLLLDLNIDSARGNLPIKVSVTLASGVSVYYAVPQYVNPSDNVNFIASVIVHGLQYGKPCHICVTDTCNHSSCISQDSVIPLKYSISFTGTCGTTPQGIITRNSSFATPNQFAPYRNYICNTFVMKSLSTLAVVDSFQFSDSCHTCNTIPAPPDSGNYLVTISDACGDFFQQTIHWPGNNNSQPSVQTSEASPNQCLDSTCAVYFHNFHGFNNPCLITLLSGPTSLHSTRNGYAYRDTLIYPLQFYGDLIYGSQILSLAPGNYTYKVSDSCHTVYGSFTLSAPQQINSGSLYLASTCDGNSQVIITGKPDNAFAFLFDFINGTGYEFNSTGSNYTSPPVIPGNYVFREYFSYGGAAPSGITCWTYVDTINIHAFNDSTFRTVAVAACNNTIHVSVIADSSNGIPPFRYSIISGPQTFAFQNSPDFIVDSFGTYLVGVMDSCGSIDARYVTIDTGRFDPIGRAGGLCVGGAAKLFDVSSPYFTYTWYKPGGGSYTGDTLNIYPFTQADTGLYFVKKVVQINGCRDSAFSTYHLLFDDTFHQSIIICSQDTYAIGIHRYYTPGIYYDTLTGAYGCDSIIITTIRLTSSTITITPDSLSPCLTTASTITVSGGVSYNWLPGNYTGNTINPAVTVPTVYTLIAIDSFGCTDTLSITVYPIPDSVRLSKYTDGVCAGVQGSICLLSAWQYTSYIWSDGETDSCLIQAGAGTYNVTATNANGCNLVSGNVNVQEYITNAPVIFLNGSFLNCTNAYVTYQWYLDNNAIPGATNYSLDVVGAGVYFLVVTDIHGCSTTSNQIVITSINNLTTTPQISVSPNPNNTNQWQVTVSAELTNAQCEVFDVDGKQVYTTHLTGTSNSIKTNLAAGTYIMRITTGQSIYNVKLVQF